jgi:hypothetical protein
MTQIILIRDNHPLNSLDDALDITTNKQASKQAKIK